MTHLASNPLQSRLDAARKAIAATDLDALLVTEIVNVGYLTGFTGSAAYALIGAKTAILITDSRYTLRAKNECPLFDVVISPSSGGYLEALKEYAAKHSGLRNLGFESSRVTVSQWEQFKRELPAIDWKPVENLVEKLRAVKDSGEVDNIRAAITIAEDAFSAVKSQLTRGISERDFAVELEFAMRRLGAEAVAFETIVASGPQSAHPHHRPNDKRLAAGDWVTVDWGAIVNGYCSDITRTVFVGPETLVTGEHRRVYDTVLQAQRRAIAAIAPGLTGQSIDAIARGYISDQGYGENFGHSLGHALGRTVHDGPGFSTRTADLILTPGMVLTVEPGIYIENWGGIRIEEDILVTETGCEVLTHLPNALEIVG